MLSTIKRKSFGWLSFAIVAIFLVAISFHYHRDEINKYPSYIHAWAQADHYALALGFTENGYDFFHPQTYNLNKQFPNNFTVPSSTRNTSADFPIHAYIPAILMGITGSIAPFWMRIYLLVYSLVGLFFLFFLAKELSNNYLAPFAVVAFASLSPVLLYYQATFLPSIPSLANAIIGYYFYVKHLRNGNIRSFWFALGFFTLATLARTPFAIFLVAVMCQEVFYFIQKRRINLAKCLGFSVSIVLIGGYFIYNQHLRNEYSSIFLNSLAYPDSLAHLKALFLEVTDKWGNHYFTRMHYIFFLFLLLGGIVHLFLNGKGKDSLRGKFGFQLLIASFGSLLYVVAMAKQFVDHDYYLLDSLFLPFILLVAFLSGQFILKTKLQKGVALAIIIIFTVAFQVDAHKRVKSRQQAMFWDKVELTNQNFTGSEQLLNGLNIPYNAIILVIDSQSPNTAFVHMRRRGFCIMYANRAAIENALNWNYDYVAVQNSLFSPDLVKIYPEILQQFERVGGNDNITILKRLKLEKKQSLLEIMGLNSRQPKIQSEIAFNNPAANCWSNMNIVNDPLDTTSKVGYTPRDNEWSLAFTLNDSTLRSLQSIYPCLKIMLRSSEVAGKVYLMSNYEVGKTSVCQQLVEIDFSDSLSSWKNYSFILPAIRYINGSKPNNYSLFFWNSEKKEFYYKDVSVSVY